MKRIWLVRHGQSQSQSGESTDPLNPDLSDLGGRQAKRLIEPLKDLNLDLILLSFQPHLLGIRWHQHDQ